MISVNYCIKKITMHFTITNTELQFLFFAVKMEGKEQLTCLFKNIKRCIDN